jgi:hypothetical protein
MQLVSCRAEVAVKGAQRWGGEGEGRRVRPVQAVGYLGRYLPYLGIQDRSRLVCLPTYLSTYRLTDRSTRAYVPIRLP